MERIARPTAIGYRTIDGNRDNPSPTSTRYAGAENTVYRGGPKIG